MHKGEHRSVWAVLPECTQALLVVLQVARDAPALDLKDVDKHTDMLEDCRLLGREIRVHERVLAATIPKVEDEVAEEADMVLFDVYCCAKAGGQGGGIVRAAGELSDQLCTELDMAHKISDLMEVFPLPDAPMSST
jgi:hypothetical protein